jgi:hypothetical protein
VINAYTGTQVREAEQPLLAAGFGDALMQRAAHGLAIAVIRELKARGRRIYGASIVVLTGKGNNGGDGLYAAAFLAARGLRYSPQIPPIPRLWVLSSGPAAASGTLMTRHPAGLAQRRHVPTS